MEKRNVSLCIGMFDRICWWDIRQPRLVHSCAKDRSLEIQFEWNNSDRRRGEWNNVLFHLCWSLDELWTEIDRWSIVASCRLCWPRMSQVLARHQPIVLAGSSPEVLLHWIETEWWNIHSLCEPHNPADLHPSPPVDKDNKEDAWWPWAYQTSHGNTSQEGKVREQRLLVDCGTATASTGNSHHRHIDGILK